MIHKHYAPLLAGNRLIIEQLIPATPCVRHVLERVQRVHVRTRVAPRQVGVGTDHAPPQHGLRVQEGSATRAAAEFKDGACRGDVSDEAGSHLHSAGQRFYLSSLRW